MQILKQEPKFIEAEIGDIVELLEDYTFIRKGSRGTIVGFNEIIDDKDDRIKVEFPVTEVGHLTYFPRQKDDKYIFAKPTELKFIRKGGNSSQD